MKRLFDPFVATITAILALAYAYLAWRLADGTAARLALALPFALIWIVPVLYWVGERENGAWIDEAVHFMSYLCMGWLNFAIVLCAARDALLGASSLLPALDSMHAAVRDAGKPWVWIGSFVALGAGGWPRCAGRACATSTFQSMGCMTIWSDCASCRSPIFMWDRRWAHAT
jgi:hypothetical protein